MLSPSTHEGLTFLEARLLMTSEEVKFVGGAYVTPSLEHTNRIGAFQICLPASFPR
jgi:hypothetical protein